MTLLELLEDVELQGLYQVAYFDEDKGERIDVEPEEVYDKEVNFIYSENDMVYIEVEKSE